jgi:hypothetical protein
MEKDYKVISAVGTASLETQVKQLLADGWHLHGNVVVNILKSDEKGKANILFTQSLVR